MSMAPSEYVGDPGTCVFGRAVLIRAPFTPEAQRGESGGAALGKANKGGKGKKGKQQHGTKATQSLKAEIHFLGGQGIDEVLFMEGWADGATQMCNAVARGVIYRIAGGKKIDSKPRYSTSKLQYFFRFVSPLGVIGERAYLCNLMQRRDEHRALAITGLAETIGIRSPA